MVEPDREITPGSEPRLPQSLSGDLVKLYSAEVAVPREVDAAVLARAHEQLAREPLRGVRTAGQAGRGTQI